MKELKSYIQSVNTCSESLIREVWSDQDECSMIFPKGEVEGLDAILASFYHGAMAQYETRDLQQDDVKVQEFCDITLVRFYWTLYATMKDSGEKAGACALFQTAVRHGVNTCEHSYISIYWLNSRTRKKHDFSQPCFFYCLECSVSRVCSSKSRPSNCI